MKSWKKGNSSSLLLSSIRFCSLPFQWEHLRMVIGPFSLQKTFKEQKTWLHWMVRECHVYTDPPHTPSSFWQLMVQFSVLACSHHFLLDLLTEPVLLLVLQHWAGQDNQIPGIQARCSHTTWNPVQKKSVAQGFTVVWCTGKHIQSSLAS